MLTAGLSGIKPDVTTGVETEAVDATVVGGEVVVGVVAVGVEIVVTSGAGKVICGRIWGDSAPGRFEEGPGGTGGPGGPAGAGGSGPVPDDNGWPPTLPGGRGCL